MYLHDRLYIYNQIIILILGFSIIHWKILKYNIIDHRKV